MPEPTTSSPIPPKRGASKASGPRALPPMPADPVAAAKERAAAKAAAAKPGAGGSWDPKQAKSAKPAKSSSAAPKAAKPAKEPKAAKAPKAAKTKTPKAARQAASVSSSPAELEGAPKVKPQREVDPKSLSPEDARKRVGAIYKLERAVEAKRITYAAARKVARSAKAELAEAEDRLETEIREQRLGPGPLFSKQHTVEIEDLLDSEGPD